MNTVYTKMKSPVGELTLIATENGLAAVLWPKDNPARVRVKPGALNGRHPILRKAVGQLKEYFAGQRKTFDLVLDFDGTDFQKEVWRALLTIPFGETRSYAEIARAIKKPKTVRAVGAANGRNPISIVAPCHRVIGSNGKLTGFAGGLETKAMLLKLEGAQEFSRNGRIVSRKVFP